MTLSVDVAVPEGYSSVDEFLEDCAFWRAPREPIASTQPMRDRIRELATLAGEPRDDFDRAIIIVLDDLERLVKRYGL